MALLSSLNDELRGLFNLLFPATCPLCRSERSDPASRGPCADCLTQLPSLPASRCPRCALPYATAQGSVHHCEACLREPPAFVGVVAGGPYEGLLRDSIHRFKYEGAIHLDRALGALLTAGLEREWPDFKPDLILPVPLHLERLRQRGYNQALLLAQQLGRQRRLPVLLRRLRRIRPTPPQQGLPLAARQHNLRGAFALAEPLRGERVLLVDDVMTTGATLRECARVLQAGGAGDILVAVLGRAARHH